MRVKVTANILNVRKLPSYNGPVIGSLTKDAIVEVAGKEGDWYEIKFEGSPAFIHSDYAIPVAAPEKLKGKVTAALLNVRSEASLSSTKLGTLNKDAVVEIISESEDWYQIKFNERIAFVYKTYVDIFEPTEAKKGFITSDILNVRAGPDTSASIVGTLTKGTEVNIISSVGAWYKLKLGEAEAYIHSNFVSTGDYVSQPEHFWQREDLKQISIIPEIKFPQTGTKEEKRAAKTWNQFGNLVDQLSNRIGIDTAAAIAVICVESAGSAFSSNGKMIIRFENHQFYKWWGKYNKDKFKKHFKYLSSQVWKGHKWRKSATGEWQTFHGNQSKEWNVLNFARSLDDTAALKSISMGAPQIMGFNYKAIGYSSVQKMFDNFSNDIRFHILGLFDFLDNNMISALRNNDFVTFAKYYNGAGQADDYGDWIKDHFDAYTNMIT